MSIVDQSGSELAARGRGVLTSRSTWFFVALIVLLGILSFAARTAEGPAAYDPESTSPNGTKALATLLAQLNSKLTVGSEPEGEVVLLLDSSLPAEQEQSVDTWVRRGGTLVIGDSFSSLSSTSTADLPVLQQRNLNPACSSQFVADVGRIAPRNNPRYAALEAKASVVGCFPLQDGYYMQVEQRDAGMVITLADPEIFTNARLGELDNSVLVTNLLRARDGGSVTMLQAGGGLVEGDRTLAELMPGFLKRALWQLPLAALALILWRARRLGKPIVEQPVVEIPASALVRAVGDLMQAAGQSGTAAELLRHRARVRIAKLLGLPPDTDPRSLARIAANRTSVPEDRLMAAMIKSPSDDQDLLSVAQSTETVQREVSNAR